MLLRCAVLLLYLNIARTEDVGASKDFVSDVDEKYSYWPSIHHGIRLMRLRKRDVEPPPTKADAPAGQTEAQSNADGVQGANEGQTVIQSVVPDVKAPIQTTQSPEKQISDKPPGSIENKDTGSSGNVNKKDKNGDKASTLDNKTVNKHETVKATSVNSTSTSTINDKAKVHNATATEPQKINLSDPGVMKRAAIVFGGFALLATAYYFFIYRKKGNSNDAKNTHSSIDPNQFRYGVLQSEDKRSNMELSRVPLTMESDDDDDEDLEIFDLGQKKKSLSYINLEQHDEDIVLNDSRSIDMENLLVDIEEKNSDTLINWSGNGSKSIL